jgi:hypothetical protein
VVDTTNGLNSEQDITGYCAGKVYAYKQILSIILGDAEVVQPIRNEMNGVKS